MASVVIASASVGANVMLAPATAQAASGPSHAVADPPESLRQRATSIMNDTYGGFMVAKRSKEHPFDWRSNGCNWPTPPLWAWEQNVPCQQHDFGYRNFGSGLKLDRTEARRAWIDGIFLREMLRNCKDLFPYPYAVVAYAYADCVEGAHLMYAAVRNFNDWRD